MSCWCDELVDYKCIDCEKPKLSRPDKLIIKKYVNMIHYGFDPENPGHKSLMLKIIERKLSPTMLTTDEIRKAIND